MLLQVQQVVVAGRDHYLTLPGQCARYHSVVVRVGPRHSKPETTMFVSATTRIRLATSLTSRGDLRFYLSFCERWRIQVSQTIGRRKQFIDSTATKLRAKQRFNRFRR